MKSFLCYLWLIIFPALFAGSVKLSERRSLLKKTMISLHALGPKTCQREMQDDTTYFDLCSTFSQKKTLPEDIKLKISFNSIFELFKKNITHWNRDALLHLRELLNRQSKSYENFIPVASSELETLVSNFKQLDHFLTRENFKRCAWEIVRDEILCVMHKFHKII